MDRARPLGRAWALGVSGGLVVSVSGLVAYYVVPLVTGEGGRGRVEEIGYLGVSQMMGSSATYHIGVLAVPSFLVTVVGLLIAHRRGWDTRWDDLEVVAGVVLTPQIAAVFVFLFGVVWFAFYSTVTAIGSLPAEEAWYFIPALLLYTLWAFVLGFVFLIAIVLPVLVLTAAAGTLGGYLFAHATTRFSRWARERSARSLRK